MEDLKRARTEEEAGDWPLARHLQCKVRLLWAKGATALYVRVSRNVLIEVCQFLSFRPLLVAPWENGILAYDLETCSGRVLEYEEIGFGRNPPQGFSLISIGDNQMFLCGGCSSPEGRPKSAYLIHEDCVSPLPEMHAGRFLHALYYDEDSLSVFAFGGAPATLQCERFSILEGEWRLLPSMSEYKSAVNACGCRGKVFICGDNARTCEVFSIASGEFSQFVTFPTPQASFFSAVWDGQLHIIQNNRIQCYNLRTGKAQAGKEVPGLNRSFPYKVEREGCVYALDYSARKLVCIELTEVSVRSLTLAIYQLSVC